MSEVPFLVHATYIASIASTNSTTQLIQRPSGLRRRGLSRTSRLIAARRKIVQKLLGCCLPRVFERVGATSFGIDPQRGQRRSPQVLIEHASNA